MENIAEAVDTCLAIKLVSVTLATLYYAPHALPGAVALYFVEWLKRLFRQPLPALLRCSQVSMCFGKAAEVAQLLIGSQ